MLLRFACTGGHFQHGAHAAFWHATFDNPKSDPIFFFLHLRYAYEADSIVNVCGK